MELKARETTNELQVNKAVSFNALKARAFDIIMSTRPLDEIIEELEMLFLTNPTTIRKGRTFAREDPGMLRRKRFWRQKRKNVY